MKIYKISKNEFDSDQQEEATRYFSVGHGDFDEKLGKCPDFIIWVLMYDHVEKSDLIKIDENTCEAINSKSHGSLWGHEFCDRTYKGRYEPETGKLTIVKPHKLGLGIDEDDALNIIYNEFYDASDIRVFGKRFSIIKLGQDYQIYSIQDAIQSREDIVPSLLRKKKKKKVKVSMQGEWWIMDGQAIFADGDVVDENHSSMVISHILAIHDIDREDVDVYKMKDEDFRKYGLSQEEIDYVMDRKDPRDYGLKTLGWKRVNGNNIETQTLTSEDMRDISNALWDMDESVETNDESFNIDVLGSGIFFENVPFSIISSEQPANLIQYRNI